MHIQCVPNSTKKACSTSCKTCGVITHETDTNMHITSLHIRSQHVPSVLHHCTCLQCCIIGRSRKTLCCTHRARLLACILMQSLSAVRSAAVRSRCNHAQHVQVYQHTQRQIWAFDSLGWKHCSYVSAAHHYYHITR